MSSQYVNLPGVGNYQWKAPVANAAALPTVNNLVGDARVDEQTSVIYIWSGSAWVANAGTAGVTSLNSLTGAVTLAAGTNISLGTVGNTITINSTGGGGSGTVTSVSVASANGFAGSVANPTTTPAITISTSITGLLKGNGTAISAATAGTDYVIPSGSITGTAGNVTATSNSTLVTLSALSLPYSQITGAPGGTVTSVGLADSTGIFNITGTPVTGSGTLTLSSFQSQAQHAFFAGPSGASGAPSFRAIVSGDIPTLNQNTTGTAANITATSNSTLTTLSSLSLPYSQLSGTVPTWNQNTTGTAANITATSNSTLTTLSSLSLPFSQLSGQATLAQLPSIGSDTVLGNVTGGTAVPTALSQTQLTALVNSFTSSLSGAAPASGGGTTKYLRADGTWAAPGGSGTVTSVGLADSTGIFNISGSPVTSSGTLGLASLIVQANNTVLAGPLGANTTQIIPSGSGTYTVPAGYSVSKIEIWGAGGGSGGSYTGGYDGGGGGGGGYSSYTLPTAAVSGTVIAYAVGTGGTAGAFPGGTGGAGGNTTCTTYSLTANGGGAGGGTGGGGGSGGAASGGTTNTTGSNGTAGSVSGGSGGNGGASPSGGATQTGTSGAATAGNAPGGGASGAGGGGNSAGAAGANGQIKFTLTAVTSFRALVSADIPALSYVTSVGLTDSTGLFTITGSPVTSSGNLTLSAFASQSQNAFLAGPSSGGAGAAAFRAIAVADVPTLNQNTTGTASNITASSNSTLTTLSALSLPGSQVTGNISGNAANITATSNSTLTTLSNLVSIGTVTTGTWNATTIAVAHGGTGQTSASAAFSALSPISTTGDIIYSSSGTTNSRLGIGSTGNVLTVVGGVPAWAAPATSGTVTSVAMTVPTFLSISGSPITSSGTLAVTLSGTALPIANGGTGVTSVTTAPTASAWSGWDANKNYTANAFIPGFTTQATAASTLTMTIASAETQIFTGTTASQVVSLPTTSVVAGGTYTIINLSNQTIAVQSSGAGAIQTMAANTQLVVTALVNTPTTAANWTATYSFLAGGAAGISALTGDVTASGSGSVAATLAATTNSTLATLSGLTTASSLASVGTITSGTWNATTIAIAHGGTGQTTASAAFSALSPITTTGDIIYSSSGTTNSRLAVGSTGNVLTVSGGVPSWAAPAAGAQNYASGYSGPNVTWSSSSSSFATPAISYGSSSYTSVVSSGITVTAAGSNAPGITFTPSSSTAVYQITATYMLSSVVTGAACTISSQMFNSTSSTSIILSNDFIVPAAAGTYDVFWPVTITGVVAPGSASAQTIVIQIAVSNNMYGNIATISNQQGLASGRGVQWTITQIAP